MYADGSPGRKPNVPLRRERPREVVALLGEVAQDRRPARRPARRASAGPWPRRRSRTVGGHGARGASLRRRGADGLLPRRAPARRPGLGGVRRVPAAASGRCGRRVAAAPAGGARGRALGALARAGARGRRGRAVRAAHALDRDRARPPDRRRSRGARARAGPAARGARVSTPTLFAGGGWYWDAGVGEAVAELGYADCTATAFRPPYLEAGRAAARARRARAARAPVRRAAARAPVDALGRDGGAGRARGGCRAGSTSTSTTPTSSTPAAAPR